MKAIINITIFVCFLFVSFSSFALDIDEKLTLRFLKVSSSKKTILINRGAEDGLVVGNHAKFFTTSGVIARGVVEKVSPSRSIWSLYRIIDVNEITDGKVLNLKIGTPVKISEDSSKSLNQEPVPSGSDNFSEQDQSQAQINAPITEANKTTSGSDTSAEVDSFEEDNVDTAASTKPGPVVSVQDAKSVDMPVGQSEKQWELWGNVSANMLSGTATNLNPVAVTSSTAASSSSLDLSIGVERYFFNSSDFLKDISVTGFFRKRTAKYGYDVQVSENLTEYGAGIRYHFNQSSRLTNAIVPFALLDGGIGSIVLQNTITTATTTTADTPLSGTSRFFALGGGAKYILANGLGFKSIVDYYSTSESYVFAASSGTRVVSGLRLQVGLSYRF